LTGKTVKNGLAMTGEITLRGLVLPVGGIKEKVLAASRAGIKEVILPERCRNDLVDVPDSAKKKLKVYFVTRMNEVLAIALGLGSQGTDGKAALKKRTSRSQKKAPN
jgi:ATP-dependent Lon protease